MRTIDQHRDDVADLVRPALARLAHEPESVRLADLVDGATSGHGYRILAAHVVSPVDLPRFDNSQMDGFALRAADAGSALRVVAPIAAGVVPPALLPGTAAPIMTGARIPDGADAVVPVEDLGPERFPAALGLESIVVPAIREGLFVRRTGSDLRAGAMLARAGDRLTPPLLGALAAASVEAVAVARRLRVLVVSTGSELSTGPELATGSELATGESGATPPPPADSALALIGDANGVSLRAALAEVGVDARAVRVSDDPAALVALLAAELETPTDLVVTTGGISMGAYEVVREALKPRGLAVTSVAMQPGGPQAWGTVDVDVDGTRVPVVAFPGNPVSALISFEVFLRPLLAEAAGMEPGRPAADLPAAAAADSPAGKHQIRRGAVVDGRVEFVGGASSHLIAHYAEATHLVHIPVGVSHIEPGDTMTTWRIR